MISGFNTDVEHGGVVYHIQTEDKGMSSKLIVSLVYDRGTILASKRTPYDDLANGDLDEPALSERLSKQHKLICAAIRAGRITELKEMTGRARTAAKAPVTTAASVPTTVASPPVKNIEPVPEPARIPVARVDTQRIVTFTSPEPPPFVLETLDDLPIFDAVTIVDEPEILQAEILPAEAIVVSEFSGVDRPPNEKLVIDLLGESKFKGGDRVNVSIMLCRGTARRVVGGAQIMVKVLGSSFRPVIFHARSDSNGLAKVHLQLPHFQAGRAAMLIRAIADGQEVEIRRIVSPG